MRQIISPLWNFQSESEIKDQNQYTQSPPISLPGLADCYERYKNKLI